MKQDKIIIYNTDLENKVNSVSLETGELALVREKDKERLYIKNTAGVVVPIHNILDGGEIELPTIQSEWIDSGMAEWSGDTLLKNRVQFISSHPSLHEAFIPPVVSDMDTLTKMNGTFGYCEGLTSLDLSNFNTSNVTDMNGMFYSCSRLTSLDLSSFDTSNVTNMRDMFNKCEGLTSLDLSNFNTNKVTNMNKMFAHCSGLTTLDLSSYNISNVTFMGEMFNGCSELISLDLSGWDVSNVTNMYNMFKNCTSLKEIKCTQATKDKILSFTNTGLPSDFNGWEIV